MASDFQADVEAVQRTESIAKILEVVCRTTGMGFAAVARVTDERWICCAVRDEIEFGLQPGGELKVETTIGHEIRRTGQPVFINHVVYDEVYAGHAAPQVHGFQSYIAMPIVRSNGTFFGTLSALDPRPTPVKTPTIINMFALFAELIAFHLDAADRPASS